MEVLGYLAAAMAGLWGVAHVVPTRQVLAGFRPITEDNRRVLLQEWLAEAFALWGLAAIIVVATAVDSGSTATAWVYRVSAGLLLALAVLTGLTGARTPVVWYRICPAVLGTSAVLLVLGSVL